MFIVRFGGDPEEFRDRQGAELLRLRTRYVRHLVATADVDEATAERVIAVLFDHRSADGRPCLCSCHPRLSDQHDDGFDCSCGWDEARRAERHAASVASWTIPLPKRCGSSARPKRRRFPRGWPASPQ